MLSVEALRTLLLRREAVWAVLAGQRPPATAGTLARLRRQWGPDAAAWVLEWLEIQQKAVEKLGPGPWLATQRALQQASDMATAMYKASRFPEAAGIYDVCCGIGADALALRQKGAVVALDCDPAIAALAGENLRSRPGAHPAAVLCLDAARFPLETARAAKPYVHIDPDRRPGTEAGGAGRVIRPEDYSPPLPVVQRWIDAALGAAVKCAPAAPLPPSWRETGQPEWISHRGSVRQQVVWFGGLQHALPAGHHIATRVDRSGCGVSFTGDPTCEEVPRADQPKSLIVDLDGAVRAAGLSVAFAGRWNLETLDGPSGFFTTDQPPEHPLASVYDVLWSGSGGVKQIKRAAAALAVRLQEIKVRGGPQRPEQLRPALADKRTAEGPEATLLIGRRGRGTYAAIARRIDSAE
ncbi:hypothetical protein [Roseimaritima sediminicola]|uniref:hypothetical protein n=1 Tax=Roseimaritima sediminicola TaxID=2662066 RepID=UPI00129834F1|nr:hypothetical protein [Roseimaritima sediminicola]